MSGTHGWAAAPHDGAGKAASGGARADGARGAGFGHAHGPGDDVPAGAPWSPQPAQQHLQVQTITETDTARAAGLVRRVHNIFGQRVVGQDGLRTALVSTLIAGGHVLLESVPGLAKTTAAHTLAAAVSGTFHRIQCTPDLMPNDIVGTQIFNYATGEFTTQLGPVHANLVLLDEINRSSAKTQSAMLEAMQEGQTSIGGRIYPLPQPFMVLATQNPIEEEGTYVLPEAQMDRFLMKEVLTYPTPGEEVEILELTASGALTAPLEASPIALQDVLYLRELVGRVYVDLSVKQYIVALVNTTRGGGPRPLPDLQQHVRVGASPRGAIALMRVAQAVALQAGRAYVVPDDVRRLRHAVLRHRLVRTYDALANNVAPEAIIDAVFAAVPAP
ncbi:AAA family ATPase [Georgenia sp. AZ-5]|uniref:AAA family ATPase n=1 Tax=Georgenia sp. AZ-5 TaxID=3367526 RepID=UPI0037549976